MIMNVDLQYFAAGFFIGMMAGMFIPDCVGEILRYKNRKKGYIIPVAVTCKTRMGRIGVILGTALLCGGVTGVLHKDFFSMGLVLLFAIIGMVLSIIDLEIRIIPNEALPILFIISLFYCYRNYGVVSGGIAMLVTFAMFLAVAMFMKVTKGVPGIGAGDVKLVSVCACAVGLQGLMYLYPALAILLVVSCTLRFRMFSWGILGKDFPMCGHIVLATYMAFLFLG